MKFKIYLSIFAIILSTIALLITYLSYRNKLKYQKPKIEVTSELIKDNMYPTMNNYYFSIFVNNFGEIPVTIDNPLELKITNLKSKKVINKIITGYNLNVGKLPSSIKQGDNIGRRYIAKKNIKIKFEKEDRNILIEVI